MSCPEGLQYTTDHEWLRTEGDISTVGVTAYATEALGDVVYLDLPQVGTTLVRGQACGEV